MNIYQKGFKAWCKIPHVTRAPLICTITEVHESGCAVDLPCTMRGISKAFVKHSDMELIKEQPKPAKQTKEIAPADSPYGRIKQRFVEMSRSKPPQRPEPKREEPIQKQASKPKEAGSIYQLLNHDDLTPEEIKLMQEIEQERQ